ncbi:hypothetical protein B9W64_00115 [Streptomyces sp. CS159]|nr:hypothetical protein B9W64_00115 [Streptomyces sp. CS159]
MLEGAQEHPHVGGKYALGELPMPCGGLLVVRAPLGSIARAIGVAGQRENSHGPVTVEGVVVPGVSVIGIAPGGEEIPPPAARPPQTPA